MTDKAAAKSRLMALKADFYAHTHAVADAAAAGTATGALVEAAFAAGAAVDKACEEFRRAYYPKAGRIVAARDEVYVQSPTGRVTKKVYA